MLHGIDVQSTPKLKTAFLFVLHSTAFWVTVTRRVCVESQYNPGLNEDDRGLGKDRN